MNLPVYIHTEQMQNQFCAPQDLFFLFLSKKRILPYFFFIRIIYIPYHTPVKITVHIPNLIILLVIRELIMPDEALVFTAVTEGFAAWV